MRIKQNNVHESSLPTSKGLTNAAPLFIYQSSILNACLHVGIFFFDAVQIRRETLKRVNFYSNCGLISLIATTIYIPQLVPFKILARVLIFDSSAVK